MDSDSRLINVSTPAESFEDARNAFIAYCESKNLSHRTIDYYRARLLSLSRYLAETGSDSAPVRVTRATVRDFLTHERERC